MPDSVEEVRQRLIDALTTSGDLSVGRIDQVLALSADLARADPDHVRFETDAGLIGRLGAELVARHETAMAELVKNAYDADATQIHIYLEEKNGQVARLKLVDNGHGMTREQLVGGFMRLATADKVNEPVSPKYRRARAGRKGIGRFAVQRLGEHLEIRTVAEGGSTELRISIDWREFSGGRDLVQIASKIEEVPKTISKGTVLTISRVSDPWSEKQVQTVFRHVVSLLQPFPLRRVQGKADSDPGFQAYWYRNKDEFLSKEASLTTEFFKHAYADVRVEIDKEGQAVWAVKCSRHNLDVRSRFSLVRDNPAAKCSLVSDISLHARYFILESKYFPKNYFSTARDILQREGGIRLYRNGYRVLPYGKLGDDWLNLDLISSQRSRVLAPTRNRNFCGFVELTDPDGKLFEETSSREGLIENRAFEELRLVLTTGILNAVKRLDAARSSSETKRKRKAPNSAKQQVQELEQLLRKLVVHARAGSQEASSAPDVEELIKQVEAAIGTVAEAAAEQERLVDENELLRILATMGITVAEFTHEFQAHAQMMSVHVKRLAAEVDANTGLGRTAQDLRSAFSQMETYTSYFGSMITENARRDVGVIDLYEVADEFRRMVAPMCQRTGTTLELEEPEDFDILTVPMHRSEWSSVMLNFLTNSIKAIRRANSGGRILLQVGRSGSTVWLDFSDNGDGIEPEHWGQVFNAFFSTTSASATEARHGLNHEGTGLGLKIVRDIAEGVGGTAKVVQPPNGYSTRLRVSVPAAKEEDQ